MSGGGTRSGRRKTGGSGTSTKPSGELVRGIPQSEIDKLRGARDHFGQFEFPPDKIQEDYKRIGRDISLDEAKNITQALWNWSSADYCQKMRAVAAKSMQGKALDANEQRYYSMYQRMSEYLKIAPTYKGTDYVYRGIRNKGDEYSKKLLSLKPGDNFDLSKLPSSFSAKHDTAFNYGTIGNTQMPIILKMPVSKLKNSCAGVDIGDKEVIVSDYNWKVSKVEYKSNEIVISF